MAGLQEKALLREKVVSVCSELSLTAIALSVSSFSFSCDFAGESEFADRLHRVLNGGCCGRSYAQFYGPVDDRNGVKNVLTESRAQGFKAGFACRGSLLTAGVAIYPPHA